MVQRSNTHGKAWRDSKQSPLWCFHMHRFCMHAAPCPPVRLLPHICPLLPPRLCGTTDMFDNLTSGLTAGSHVNTRCRPDECDLDLGNLHGIFQGAAGRAGGRTGGRAARGTFQGAPEAEADQ